MNYKKHTITKTDSTTDILKSKPFGRVGTYKTTAYLYEIDGPIVSRERGRRPFFTTIKECKDFINEEIDRHDYDLEQYKNWERVTRTPHDPYGSRNT